MARPNVAKIASSVRAMAMFDTIAKGTAFTGDASPAPNTANTIAKPERLRRAKAAVEAGEQSFHDAAEALGVAQELHGATQAEMARAIGRSEAWVSLLLRWRRLGYTDNSPFGPTTKADRLKHAKDLAASGKSTPRKSRNRKSTASTETPIAGFSQPTAEPARETTPTTSVVTTGRWLSSNTPLITGSR